VCVCVCVCVCARAHERSCVHVVFIETDSIFVVSLVVFVMYSCNQVFQSKGEYSTNDVCVHTCNGLEG